MNKSRNSIEAQYTKLQGDIFTFIREKGQTVWMMPGGIQSPTLCIDALSNRLRLYFAASAVAPNVLLSTIELNEPYEPETWAMNKS